MRYKLCIFLLISIAIMSVGCTKNGFTDALLATDSELSELETMMTVTPQAFADGVSRSTISILFRDVNGKPLSGRSMKITVSGTGNSLTNCPTSGANGYSICYLTSTQAEAKIIIATGKFILSAKSIFLPAANHMKLFYSLTSGGNYQRTPSGQKLMVTLGQAQTATRTYDLNNKLRLKGNIAGQMWEK